MNKCQICGKEGFREFNGMMLCVQCYMVNVNGKFSKYGKFIKRENDFKTKTYRGE